MSNILVVDDEKNIRDALVLLLMDKGHSIDTAEDGVEALARMDAREYDLVLTDLNMPRMHGMELIRNLKSRGKQKIPVVLITAFASEDSVASYLQAGAVDLITKPFDIKRILAAIDMHISRAIPAPTEVVNKSGLGVALAPEIVLPKSTVTAESAESVAAAGHTTDNIVSTLFTMIQRHFQADYSRLLVVQAGQISADLKNQVAPPTTGSMQWEENLLAAIAKSGEAVLIPDVSQDQAIQQAYGLREGSLMAVPLKSERENMGGILLFKREVRSGYNSETVKFVAILADLIAMTLSKDAHTDTLNDIQTDAIQALLAIIEIMDPYISSHSARVACYTLLLAKKMQMSEPELRQLEFLALLHDIGKIAIPEKIMHKQTDLSEAELDLLKTHSSVGENIVQPLRFIENAGSIIRHHHENYDGSGYPDKLKGAEIPLFSRLIAVADTFDHLLSQYSHKDKEGRARTIDNMIKLEGKQLDPELLRTFLNAYFKIVMLNQ